MLVPQEVRKKLAGVPPTLLLANDDSEAPDNSAQDNLEGSGKLPTRPRVNQLNCLSAAQTVALLHVRDTVSGIYFLVDTGAEVSIVPPTQPDLLKPPGLNLIAANGSRIKSFGTRQMTIKIDNMKYAWNFQIADVQKSILGADFLRANSLLVDLANKRLINGPSSVKGVLKKVPTDICSIGTERAA